MAITMKAEEAYELRMAFEPATRCMVNEDAADEYSENVIPMASIAISLKRIADALEKSNEQGKFKR